MSRRRSPLALARDAAGAAAVEFALISMPLAIVLMATLDLGYTTYVKTLVQGALQSASRDAALGNRTPTEIDADVKATLAPLITSPPYSSCAAAPQTQVPLVCTTVRSYFDFSRIGKPEKLIVDNNGNGQCNTGDQYEDANDNKVFDDGTGSGRSNAGNADEVVAYTVKVVYRRMLPVAGLLGWSNDNTIIATTMLRNQPFAKPVLVVTRSC